MRSRQTLFALIAALAAAPSGAAETGDRFGDWTTRCVEEAEGPESCALVQRITAQNGAFSAEMGLNPTTASGVRRLIVILLTPEGADLSINPVVAVDDEPGHTPLAWQTCARGVCRAAAVLSPEAEASLREGDSLIAGWRAFRAEEPTQITLSLDGAAAGLTALTVQ